MRTEGLLQCLRHCSGGNTDQTPFVDVDSPELPFSATDAIRQLQMDEDLVTPLYFPALAAGKRRGPAWSDVDLLDSMEWPDSGQLPTMNPSRKTPTLTVTATWCDSDDDVPGRHQ
jgi:hypothetical protein